MASMNMTGKNLLSIILHLGPTSLSLSILANSSPAFSLLVGFVLLQKRSNRYNTPPVGDLI